MIVTRAYIQKLEEYYRFSFPDELQKKLIDQLSREPEPYKFSEQDIYEQSRNIILSFRPTDRDCDMLTAEEALERLQQSNITGSMQMLRRWLREGSIPGVRNSSRKMGWRISESALQRFITSRQTDITKLQQQVIELTAEVMRLTEENRHLQEQRTPGIQEPETIQHLAPVFVSQEATIHVTPGNMKKANSNMKEKNLNVTDSNVTRSNEKISICPPGEWHRSEVERLWQKITRGTEELPAILEEVHQSLIKGLFPEQRDCTATFNGKFKRPFVCPFTNKKFGSVENLIRSAVPVLIRWKKLDRQRQREMEEREILKKKQGTIII